MKTIIERLHNIENTLGNIETELEEIKDLYLDSDNASRAIIRQIQELLANYEE